MEHIESWQGGTKGIIARHLADSMPPMWQNISRCGAVLLNPAVNPARDIEKFMQEHNDIPQEKQIYFQPQYIEELHALQVTRPCRSAIF